MIIVRGYEELFPHLICYVRCVCVIVLHVLYVLYVYYMFSWCCCVFCIVFLSFLLIMSAEVQHCTG